jgi:HAD superfamily hydrolase (TIGR01509 family)
MPERALRNGEHDVPILSHMDSIPEALVFDFDGVIANTEPLYWRAWCELLKPYAIPFEWDDYCRIGRGIRDEKMLASLAEIVVDTDVMAQIEQRLPERKEMVLKWKLEEPPIAEPTVQLLKSLTGWTLGLVTSSDRADIELLLHNAGIANCFHACVFGEEIRSHKPDPAPYLLIRKKLGIRGGVAFEDSDAGLLSAAAAGFHTIRVSSPDDLPRLVRELVESEGMRRQ